MRQHSGCLWIALILLPLSLSCGWGQKRAAPTDGTVAAASKAQAPVRKAKTKGVVAPLALAAVDFSDAVRPVVKSGAVELALAKNEWSGFVLQVGPRVPGVRYAVRINEPAPAGAAAAASGAAWEVAVYQVMSMPVDVNRAGYVRHTGQNSERGELPRALLPMKVAADGTVELSQLRDASRPSDPAASAPPAEPALLWVDVRLPPDAPAGDYTGACKALSGGKIVSSVPLKLKVHDFVLPAERHLQLVGQLKWEDLQRLYPDRFEAIRARLMNRTEANYAGAVQTIDSLVKLAHVHRTSVFVPLLQPTVKWTPNEPPSVDWKEFDSLVQPWLSGEAFEDKIPTGFWPMPGLDMLDRFKRESQLQYWSEAARHFDGYDWIDRAPIWIDKLTPGRATEAEAAEQSKLAAQTLAMNERVRAAVPLETDQLIVAETPEAAAGKGLDPSTTGRLMSAAPGLVSAPPMRLWPDAAERPMQYLRTDMPSLVPYIGAGGDERDVRLWAWLAFLRQAAVINFSDALPSLTDPTEKADPNELIWFYPGEWFGMNEAVPTIQLKWLRRAQQDYEYLWLARERAASPEGRDTRLTMLLMARLMTKPVEVQPGQNPDPAYALMSGTTSQDAWNEAQRLLSDLIELHKPGQAVDPVRAHAVHIAALRWAQPLERPLVIGRTTEWAAESNPPELWLHLRLGVDIYNASDVTQGQNLLGWTFAPPGWQIDTQAAPAPVLPTYNVRRGTLSAKFDLAKITPAARKPMELTFTDGYKKDASSLQFVLPVATSDRREGRLAIDGKLDDDWNPADLVHDGALVKMLSRPGIQQQKIAFAEKPSKVYTSWAAGNFYVAFDVGGVSPNAADTGQNFVDYQFRRAWGEELCEILIQPINASGVPGPVLHVVCKPNGTSWVERKTAAGPRDAGNAPWQEVEARIPYKASRADADRWRGEVAIPWKAILEAVAPPPAGDVNANNRQPGGPPREAEPPALLRFNFVQHRAATGESASWSGPVDFGRDDSFMGVLYLRDPEEPGPRNIAADSARRFQVPAVEQ